MSDHEPLTLYAWVGEDELGSGVVGIKQGFAASGDITALAAINAEKLTRYTATLQAQADRYGKPIRLIACREWETLLTIRPHIKPTEPSA